MVELAYLSLFQLRAYSAYLERELAEFRKANPKPKVKSIEYTAKLDWYTKEFEQTTRWINSKEADEVRKALDVKAQKFMYPRPVIVVSKKSHRFETWKYRVEDFFINMFGAPRG